MSIVVKWTIWNALLYIFIMLFLLFSRQVTSDSFVTPWTVVCQPPLSMGFPRQQYWRGFPFPSPHIYYTNILYTHTYIFYFLKFYLDGKESVCNAGDPGLILGSGTFSGEGNSYPLQYSCLKNSTGRGAWPTTVHGLQKVGHYWVTNTHTHFLQEQIKFGMNEYI